ncbi:MAG: LysE family translocator [Vibrio sp.]
MELWHGLILITSIHLLAAASPGPDFILVSQQTLTNGKKAGLLCSLGIALGLSVHILYSAFGLAAFIAHSANLLWIIKVLGGAYLMYLGFQGLRSKAKSNEELVEVSEKPLPQSNKKMVGMGFLCNVLNPKAPIYFVSLFTLVLSADMPLYQIAIYGVWIMILQFAWFAFIVMLLSRPAVNRKFKQCGHWIDRVLGGAMMALGIKLLIMR